MRHFQHILFAAIAAFLLAFAMPVQGQWSKLLKGIKPPKPHHVSIIPEKIRIPSSNNARSHTTPHIASHVTPEASILSPTKDLDKITIRRTEQQIQAYDEYFIRDLEKKGLLAVQQHQVLMQELQEIRRKYKPEEWLKGDYIYEKWKIIQKYARQQARKHRETLREEMQEPPKEEPPANKPATSEDMTHRDYSRLIKICVDSAIEYTSIKLYSPIRIGFSINKIIDFNIKIEQERHRTFGDNIISPSNTDTPIYEPLPFYDFAA